MEGGYKPGHGAQDCYEQNDPRAPANHPAAFAYTGVVALQVITVEVPRHRGFRSLATGRMLQRDLLLQDNLLALASRNVLNVFHFGAF